MNKEKMEIVADTEAEIDEAINAHERDGWTLKSKRSVAGNGFSAVLERHVAA